MSALSPIVPGASLVPNGIAEAPGRPAPLPGQRAAAPTVEVPPQAVQAASGSEAQRGFQPSDEELEDAVEKVGKAVSAWRSELEFSVDKESGTPVVKVIDRQTEQVIRQIPSEEMLRIAKSLDKILGVFVEQKV